MKQPTEMNKQELRKELAKHTRELRRYRLRKPPYKDFEYEDYTTYYVIYDSGVKFVRELKDRGTSRACRQRIDTFIDEAFKTERMLEAILGC